MSEIKSKIEDSKLEISPRQVFMNMNGEEDQLAMFTISNPTKRRYVFMMTSQDCVLLPKMPNQPRDIVFDEIAAGQTKLIQLEIKKAALKRIRSDELTKTVEIAYEASSAKTVQFLLENTIVPDEFGTDRVTVEVKMLGEPKEQEEEKKTKRLSQQSSVSENRQEPTSKAQSSCDKTAQSLQGKKSFRKAEQSAKSVKEEKPTQDQKAEDELLVLPKPTYLNLDCQTDQLETILVKNLTKTRVRINATYDFGKLSIASMPDVPLDRTNVYHTVDQRYELLPGEAKDLELKVKKEDIEAIRASQSEGGVTKNILINDVTHEVKLIGEEEFRREKEKQAEELAQATKMWKHRVKFTSFDLDRNTIYFNIEDLDETSLPVEEKFVVDNQSSHEEILIMHFENESIVRFPKPCPDRGEDTYYEECPSHGRKDIKLVIPKCNYGKLDAKKKLLHWTPEMEIIEIIHLHQVSTKNGCFDPTRDFGLAFGDVMTVKLVGRERYQKEREIFEKRAETMKREKEEEMLLKKPPKKESSSAESKEKSTADRKKDDLRTKKTTVSTAETARNDGRKDCHVEGKRPNRKMKKTSQEGTKSTRNVVEKRKKNPCCTVL